MVKNWFKEPNCTGVVLISWQKICRPVLKALTRRERNKPKSDLTTVKHSQDSRDPEKDVLLILAFSIVKHQTLTDILDTA